MELRPESFLVYELKGTSLAGDCQKLAALYPSPQTFIPQFMGQWP